MAVIKYTIACVLVFLSARTEAAARFTLRLNVSGPVNTNDIYISGVFNNWNPGDANYRLQYGGNGLHEIVLNNLPAGEYRFKFTRGNAATIECSAVGTNITARVIRILHDTSVNLVIAAWSDSYVEMANLPDSMRYEAMMARAGYYIDINLDSSYKYAVQLYDQAKKLHMPVKLARALDLQAAVFTKQGNEQQALSLLMNSLEIKKQLNDSNGGVSYTYSSIGKIYESMGELSNAKENYLRSAQWLNKRNEIFKAASFTDIGNFFLKQHNADSAEVYVARAARYNPNYFGALLLLGDIDSKKDSFYKALTSYRAAAVASSRGTPGSPFYYNAAEAFKKMALVFDALHDKDSAYWYARKAFTIARQVNNPAAIVGASTVLIELFRKDKIYDSAFTYQQLLLQKKDSLFTVEKERQLHNVYFNEKLRQQEALANAEKNQARLKIYLSLGITGLMVLVVIGYRLLLKNKYYKQLAEIEMRALRAQMNPHFIFNCLASINRYIVRSDAKTASDYLTKFSTLIRLILDNSANELVSIDTEIKTLCLYTDMELLRFDNAFDFEIEHGTVAGADITAIPSMIIQPYVENAIWHGLLPRATFGTVSEIKGKLWLRFLPCDDGVLKIEIEDNGIGRKKAAEFRGNDMVKTKSYGMQLGKDRIELINRQYHIQSTVSVIDLFDENGQAAGTKVVLYLPLIEMVAQSEKQS